MNNYYIIHNPIDLSNKLKKGIELDGPAYLNVLSPCIPRWRIGADMAVEVAHGGVETCFWPLYEVEDGQYKINYKPKEKPPIKDWLLSQGRFKHLKDPKFADLINTSQAQIDEQWAWLLAQETQA